VHRTASIISAKQGHRARRPLTMHGNGPHHFAHRCGRAGRTPLSRMLRYIGIQAPVTLLGFGSRVSSSRLRGPATRAFPVARASPSLQQAIGQAFSQRAAGAKRCGSPTCPAPVSQAQGRHLRVVCIHPALRVTSRPSRGPARTRPRKHPKYIDPGRPSSWGSSRRPAHAAQRPRPPGQGGPPARVESKGPPQDASCRPGRPAAAPGWPFQAASTWNPRSGASRHHGELRRAAKTRPAGRSTRTEKRETRRIKKLRRTGEDESLHGDASWPGGAADRHQDRDGARCDRLNNCIGITFSRARAASSTGRAPGSKDIETSSVFKVRGAPHDQPGIAALASWALEEQPCRRTLPASRSDNHRHRESSAGRFGPCSISPAGYPSHGCS